MKISTTKEEHSKLDLTE